MSSLTFPKWRRLRRSSSVPTSHTSTGTCLDDLLRDMRLDLQTGTPMNKSNSIIENPGRYLPVDFPTALRSGHGNIVGLPQVESEANLFSLLIATLSNNFETSKMAVVVMDLIEDPTYLAMLENLLSSRLDTVGAIAEKLLYPAVRYRRLDLFKVIVNSGVDVNLRFRSPDSFESMTALQRAVDDGHKDIVEYLLNSGATDWQALFRNHFKRTVRGNVLDLAIDRGHEDVVELLLQYMDSHDALLTKVPVCTLRIAILLGFLNIVKLLISNQPAMVDVAKRSPWHFYEAAATIKNTKVAIAMVEILRTKGGLKIHAASALSHGSMLAAAAIKANLTLIRKLILENIPLNALSVGFCPCAQSSSRCRAYGSMLGSRNRDSALHVAIDKNLCYLVKTLENYRAVWPRHDGLYPIPVVALRADSTIARVLTEAGIDVDGTRFLEVRSMEHAFHEGPSAPDPFSRAARYYSIDSQRAVDTAPNAGGIANITSAKMSARFGMQQPLPIEPPRSASARNSASRLSKHSITIVNNPGVVSIASQIRLREICEAVVVGNSVLADMLIAGGTQQGGGLILHHATRILALAAKFRLFSTTKFLLDAGISPFLSISQTYGEDLSQLDFTFGLDDDDNAFHLSTTRQTLDITSYVLRRTDGILHDIHPLLRRWRTYAVERLSLCTPGTLEHLLFKCCVNHRELDDALGLDQLRKSLHLSLGHFIDSESYNMMERVLRYHSLSFDLVNPPLRRTGHTPLQQLAGQDQSDHVQTLLNLGADVNAEPYYMQGATALQFAAINGNFKIAALLLEAGAEINAPPATYDGRTAIEGAAEWGRLDMVHYLLEAGADIQNLGNFRRTVYRAWKNGHHTVARMVHSFKREKYGEENTDSIESILQIMVEVRVDNKRV
jgi:ankyrin repeat protein